MNKKPHILFVDDEETVLRAMRRYIRDEDYVLMTAASGQEGLAVLEQTPAEIVISDFRMPEMNGGEFLRRVGERWPDTMRLVLSGYADISAVISAVNDGAIFKFILKPWQGDELKVAVQDALLRYRTSENTRRLADEALAVHQSLFADEQQRTLEIRQRNLALEFDQRARGILQNAFLSSTAGILIFDDEGRLTEINPAGRSFLLQTDDLESDDPTPIGLPADLERDIRTVLVEGNILERSFPTLGSRLSPCIVNLAPLCHQAGVRGVVAVIARCAGSCMTVGTDA